MDRIYIVFFFLTLFIAIPAHAEEPANKDRLDKVAERGSHVMTFDLEKTTHIFTKTETGGILQVIVKNKSDADQVKLIREHLSEISREFSQGNFSKPTQVHGKDMPGLAKLKTAKPDQIKIVYREFPDGAQINFSTELPQFIKAIHQWFDAQLRDHARHVVPGHQHQHMHHK